jgi:hypothetical protein
MTYCANVDAGWISRSNSLNMANIRLIRAKNPFRYGVDASIAYCLPPVECGQAVDPSVLTSLSKGFAPEVRLFSRYRITTDRKRSVDFYLALANFVSNSQCGNMVQTSNQLFHHEGHEEHEESLFLSVSSCSSCTSW